MSQREDIIGILRNERFLTQSEIALRKYGDSEHNTAIFFALQKLVQDGLVTKTEERPARYSLTGVSPSTAAPVVAKKRVKAKIEYSEDEKNSYYKIWEINNLIWNATKLAGMTMNPGDDFYVVWQPCGHEPATLPEGTMAVYSFHNRDFDCLKVGKAGPRSKDRYQYQHYKVYRNRQNSSTLAKSIVDSRMITGLNDSNVDDWIKDNCERFDVIIKIPEEKNTDIILNMIEGLLQMYFSPKFEG